MSAFGVLAGGCARDPSSGALTGSSVMSVYRGSSELASDHDSVHVGVSWLWSGQFRCACVYLRLRESSFVPAKGYACAQQKSKTLGATEVLD